MTRLALLVAGLVASGCTTMTGGLQRVEVPVATVTPCVKAEDVPPIPASRMPPPGSNVERLAAGASADVRELLLYAQRLRDMLLACAQ